MPYFFTTKFVVVRLISPAQETWNFTFNLRLKGTQLSKVLKTLLKGLIKLGQGIGAQNHKSISEALAQLNIECQACCEQQ